MKLLSSQIEAYREQGFLVLEGLVNPEEVQAILADAVKLCRGEYPCKGLDPISPEIPDEEALRRLLCIHHPQQISPFMKGMMGHPGIVEVLVRIIAPDVKCMQSMLFIKPPSFPGQAWHQDEIYIPTRDRSLTGAWIALDDATLENGCLWVIPGSQKKGYLYSQQPHDQPEEFDHAEEARGFDDSGKIPVECPAGSVVFFNGYLLHRSRKNRSNGYRRALVNHYMNAYSLLPWMLRPEEINRTGRADNRDIVMVAGEDPYAWKGTEQRHQTILREDPDRPR